MRIARPALYTRTLAFIGLAVLGLQRVSEAQVGLTSGVARVSLLARVAAQGSIHSISAPREILRLGELRELSSTVRLSANAGYQLQVRGIPGTVSRLWVQAANGEFRELAPGASVTVAENHQGTQEREREVRFRIEVPAGGTAPTELPMRYEMAISPTI